MRTKDCLMVELPVTLNRTPGTTTAGLVFTWHEDAFSDDFNDGNPRYNFSGEEIVLNTFDPNDPGLSPRVADTTKISGSAQAGSDRTLTQNAVVSFAASAIAAGVTDTKSGWESWMAAQLARSMDIIYQGFDEGVYSVEVDDDSTETRTFSVNQPFFPIAGFSKSLNIFYPVTMLNDRFCTAYLRSLSNLSDKPSSSIVLNHFDTFVKDSDAMQGSFLLASPVDTVLGFVLPPGE